MRNARLEEAQAGIKIARRNISKLRYADDTTLMAESEEELKSLLMKHLLGPLQRKQEKKGGVDLGDSLNRGHMSVKTSQEQGQALSGPLVTINSTVLPNE